MVVEVLALLPGVLLLLLANYTEKRKNLRILTQIFLAFAAVFIILEGVLILEMGTLFLSITNVEAYGYGMIITGLLSFLFFLKPIREGLAKVIDIDPDNWLHATALVFAILVMGSSLATALSFDVVSLSREIGLDLVSVIIQDSLFVIVAFFGVGWLIRRDWKKTLKRLGLVKPSLRDIAISLEFVVLLFVFVIGVGLLGALLGGGSVFETESDPTIQMLGGIGVIGAIVLALGAGIGEEILFRGALQPRLGIIFTSIIFASVHIQYFDPLTLGLLFGVSILLGYERKISNTTACIITHAGYDMIVLLFAALI